MNGHGANSEQILLHTFWINYTLNITRNIYAPSQIITEFILLLILQLQLPDGFLALESKWNVTARKMHALFVSQAWNKFIVE